MSQFSAKPASQRLNVGVQDAGGSRVGRVGEVFRCTHCQSSGGCDFCGGTGYRAICNSTECHEHGCSVGSCGATQADFDNWERSRAQEAQGKHA